jgi:hypothetical protein
MKVEVEVGVRLNMEGKGKEELGGWLEVSRAERKRVPSLPRALSSLRSSFYYPNCGQPASSLKAPQPSSAWSGLSLSLNSGSYQPCTSSGN